MIGVWDGGSVHPPAYVQKFAAEYGMPQVYPSLAALVANADCAIIHGCDWDTHIAKAQPFVEAGKAVLLDKPVAGNLCNLQQLRQWVADGVRVAAGFVAALCRRNTTMAGAAAG